MEISLTKGKNAIIDDEDIDFVSQYRWYARTGNQKKFYASRGVNGKHINLHDLIGIKYGIISKHDIGHFYIDHINGNSLDNRKKNLRKATFQQNLANRPANKNNLLGIKGISQRRGLWRARITNIHLGWFPSKEEAIMVYNKKAKEIYGPFARINEL